MRVLRWLKRYWYVPFFILLTILFWVIFKGKKGTPVEQTKRELEAIDAGRQAEEMAARYGTEAAKANVKSKYREELAALDEKKAAKAKELEDDPQKLAKFLVRAGARN